jgi:hypothetical protein
VRIDFEVPKKNLLFVGSKGRLQKAEAELNEARAGIAATKGQLAVEVLAVESGEISPGRRA